MSLAATTLSAAIGTTDTVVNVASVTNITAPNYQVGDPTKGIAASVTYLLVEQEMMKVSGPLAGLFVPVVRGELGSVVSAHGASTPVVSGLAADFPGFTGAQKTNVPPYPLQFQGFSAPVAGAATNVAPGPYFHLTGTVAMVNLTAPAGYVEGGEITIVFDGSAAGLTWTAAGNISVAGTATTAGSAVTFIFDQGSGKWHPSRLA